MSDNSDIRQFLGRRIKAIREEQQWTQMQLAAQMQKRRDVICAWERGKRLISLEDLAKIAGLLQKPLFAFFYEPGVQPDALVGGEERLKQWLEHYHGLDADAQRSLLDRIDYQLKIEQRVRAVR